MPVDEHTCRLHLSYKKDALALGAILPCFPVLRGLDVECVGCPPEPFEALTCLSKLTSWSWHLWPLADMDEDDDHSSASQKSTDVAPLADVLQRMPLLRKLELG